MQSELQKISACSTPKYANNVRISRLFRSKPDHGDALLGIERGAVLPFLQKAGAQSGFNKGFRRMQSDRKSPGTFPNQGHGAEFLSETVSPKLAR
jgi:hypothetical protein